MLIKSFWYVLFSVLIVSVLWHSGKAGYLLFHYLKLNENVSPHSIDWEIKEINDEDFIHQATYRFEVKDQEYQGKSALSDHFRNRDIAAQKMPQIKETSWKIWYNRTDPNYSSLQKKFPVKESLSAFILWCILIYFGMLRKSVQFK